MIWQLYASPNRTQALTGSATSGCAMHCRGLPTILGTTTSLLVVFGQDNTYCGMLVKHFEPCVFLLGCFLLPDIPSSAEETQLRRPTTSRQTDTDQQNDCSIYAQRTDGRSPAVKIVSCRR